MTKGQDLVPTILGMCRSLGAHADLIHVGVDVVSVEWFARQIGRGEDAAFVRNSFTIGERAYCAGRPERYAARWAAKEAVAKAVGTGFRGLRPSEIEIVHHSDGRPAVASAKNSSWPHAAHTWRWAITLCHEGDAAVAVAIGSVHDGTPAIPSVADPIAIQEQSGSAL